MDRRLHIAFCGGGSGGHLTPALAVADALGRLVGPRNQSSVRLQFFTSSRPVDEQMLSSMLVSDVPRQHVPLPVATSRGRLRYLFRVLRCSAICLRHFRKERPDVVVSTGGFAALPGLIAARLQQIPILIIEPNAVAGRAHRMTSRWAAVACLGWHQDNLPQAAWPCPVLLTGVPIRAVTSEDNRPDRARHRSVKRLLLVLGGSLGARRLNDLVSGALVESGEHLADWDIVHQTGGQDAERMKNVYERSDLDVDVQPFIEDLQPLLRRASVVVTRAGAVTLAECCQAACATIVVPLSTAADGHQSANAAVMQEQSAALVIAEDADSAGHLLSTELQRLILDLDLRTKFSQNARALVEPDASTEVAQRLLKLASVEA